MILLKFKSFFEELLNSNFSKDNTHILHKSDCEKVYNKLSYCFKNITRKYYSNNIKNFNFLNADHLAICLYLFSTQFYKKKKIDMANKFFLLNKIINSIDLYYAVKMPKIFMFCHPHASIIGNASYSDYSIFFQNVTIGRKGNKYPKFSKGVIFYPGSKIIGNCKVGNNVIFAPDSSIVDTNIPSDSLVIGKYPNIIIKRNKHNVIKDFFKTKKKIKI